MKDYFIYYDNKKRLYVWEEFITDVKSLEPIYAIDNTPIKYKFRNSNITMKETLKMLFGEGR